MHRIFWLSTVSTGVLLITIAMAVPDVAKSGSTLPVLEIERITPAGVDVPPGRQIVFQFDRTMVPLGRMEREASEVGITVTPDPDCRWRWLDTRVLACRLDESKALKPATRYTIVIRAAVKAEDGATLAAPVTHSFVTERPGVRHAWFKTWQGPGMPVIQLIFNQAVTGQSVEKHIFMEIQQPRRQRIALRVTPDPDDKQPPLHPAPTGVNASAPPQSAPSSDRPTEEPIKSAGDNPAEARRIWLVSPAVELPGDTRCELTVEPGLRSFDGPERGVANRVLATFDSFPEFAFTGVACFDNHNQKITLKPRGSKDDIGPRCNPLADVALVFTAPVIEEEVKAQLTFSPSLSGSRVDYDPWANRRGYSRLQAPHERGRRYRVSLPQVLEAYQIYAIRSDPLEFKDEFGRPLTQPIDFRFATAHRPPDFTLTHPDAVLEKQMDTEVPLVVTNLENVSGTYDRLTVADKQTDLKFELQIPTARDIAFRTPLNVRDLLEGRSGVVRGRLESRPPVSKNERERWFFAQVTPFQAHIKLGHYNTLVWVTDLATGQPVPGATVSIFQDTYQDLSRKPGIPAAVTDSSGVALLDGTRQIDPDLKRLYAYEITAPRLFVDIRKGDDLARVPLDYRYRVDAYRASRFSVSPSMRRHYGHIHAWGTTAQGVYKAGDTIQYKLYVRDQDNERFVPAPRTGYRLEVFDPTGKIVYTVADLRLSAFGAQNGQFSVPRTGAVGWYRFALTADFSADAWEPMRVLVSDFTPAPFKVTTDLDGDLFQPGDPVTATTRAGLHAGGPYAAAGSRVTATLEARPFHSNAPSATGFQFDSYIPGAPPTQTIHRSEGTLDSRGDLTTRFTIPDSDILFGRLVVESAVRDDRGKYIADRAAADFAARDRYVGLRSRDWIINEDQPATVDLLVVDAGGRPAEGVAIDVTIERRETRAARVKGAGNAYLTHYSTEWVPVDRCEMQSARQPVSCTFTPPEPGLHRITAGIRDTRNRPHHTEIRQWVAGKGPVVWQQPADNSLEIIPEKSEYRVGETARFLVQNPFPGARALVTVERYGVLKSWVQTLAEATPIVAVDVDPDFLPGFFLSVVVVSPRVEPPPSDSQVDLGKPAFRMGYVRVPVTDPYKELQVRVEPQRDTYKPRETVSVDIRASSRHPAAEEPVELAVAVLDEAVFDLLAQGRAYFDPYQGFYTLDGLDLENYSLLMRLVGSQKFEKKGANAGGGGGPDISLRSVFKFVAYWNPSIVADARGRATITFEAPDNLTGWRVLAMAVTPGDRMGLGDGRFKVNRPTEIRPVMPNQVTAGDRFDAGFTIMNRTAQSRKLSVTVTARGVIETDSGENTRQIVQTLDVAPYQRATVWLALATTGAGAIELTARGGDDLDRDGLVHTVDVRKRYRLETAAAYGSTTAEAVSEKLHFPADMRTDVGQVRLVLSPSVIGNLEGAFRYMRDYAYSCWEQVLTKGVMAAHYADLEPYLARDFSWPDSARLPRNSLDRAAEFQAPNGGMTYYLPEDRYVSPYLSAYTALAFNWLRASGWEPPAAVEKKLHAYLLTLLRRDVMPDFYTRGMASTVRAVALAALAVHGEIGLSDLQRYQPHLPQMSLFGRAHFLLAALEVPGSDAVRAAAADQILGHADQSGGKLIFSEVIDDGYTRILASTLRTNGAVLSALTAYGLTGPGKTAVGDISFKLARTITQSRGNRDHWENTQENVFCLNGLVDYRRAYERQPPDMTLQVFFDAGEMGRTRFQDLRDDPVVFEKPVGVGDPGRRMDITLKRAGQGRLYYNTRLAYAPQTLRTDGINAGIEIHREYSLERDGRWEILQNPMHLNRGDLVRVDIFVSLAAARNFVAVDDPVPGGLEPVNRDLATASTVDADQGTFRPADGSWWFRHGDWSSYGVSRWSFYHRELRHTAARFYSEYLPAGNYHLSYVAQAVAPGDFVALPVRAEEMYDPDVFGQGVPAELVVSRD